MGFWIHTPAVETDTNGQRLCARGERCAAPTSVQQPDGSWALQPAYTYQPFCDLDRAKIGRAVEHFPEYHAELVESLGTRIRAGGPKVSGSHSAALVVNPFFEALASEIVDLVAAWAIRVAHVADLDDTASDRQSRAYSDIALDHMCAQLTGHLDVLFSLGRETTHRYMSNIDADALPTDARVVRIDRNYYTGIARVLLDLDGTYAGFELLRLEARCRWALGRTGKDVDVHVPCPIPSCGMVGTVVRPDGADGLQDYAICRACRTRFIGPLFINLMRDAYEREIARQQTKAS